MKGIKIYINTDMRGRYRPRMQQRSTMYQQDSSTADKAELHCLHNQAQTQGGTMHVFCNSMKHTGEQRLKPQQLLYVQGAQPSELPVSAVPQHRYKK